MKKTVAFFLGCFFFLSPYILEKDVEQVTKSDFIRSYVSTVSKKNVTESNSDSSDVQAISESAGNPLVLY